MRNIQYLLACCLGLFFIGCNETDEPTAVQTGIRVSLQEDVKVESRKTPEEIGAPQAAKFSLKVTRQSDGNVIYDDSYTSDVIPAAAGSYSLEASYGTDELLAIDVPYYKGSAVATVEDGKTASANILCKVANALASVKFSDEGAYAFANQFSSYGVRVAVDNHSMVLSSYSGGSAYYRAGSKPTFTFEGRLASDNTLVSVAIDNEKFADASTFAAGTHCVITLKLVESAPGVTIEVSKVEVEEVTITETIPLERLPKPKVTATGFDTNNNLSFVETEALSPKLELTLASALQDIKFTFNFEDAQFTLDSSKEYLLSNADDKAIVEEALGVALPEVGATEAILDLATLVDKLQTNDGTATINSLTINVKANNRWSSGEDEEASNTYTLTCNKPEFSIAVQDANCWSREFTVDEVTVSGNADAEKIKANLVYQYYDDAEWVECTTRENVAGRVQQFAQAAEEISQKTYQVRALYRGVLASEIVEATLETPTQLPNSDMEDWHYEEVARSIITYYPWNSGSESFWNTNNSYTTRYNSNRLGLAGSNPYNCFPAVSYVVGGHSGNRAAEIRSTASGRGNTLPSRVLDLNKVAGELFTGNVSVSTGGIDASPNGDHYTIDTNGRGFSTRPTAMEFWYKYAPLNTDTWRARIVLMDENHITIVEKELQNTGSQGEWAKATVDLDYVDGQSYAKCQYIYVVFSSTITTGNAMQWTAYNSYVLWQDDVQVTFDDSKCWVGSVLTIDDITLVYNK